MSSRAPTLQTIADRAGVSKNTVSCALRSDPRISEKTRQRIRQIANELGYRPNPMVSALMHSLRQSHPVANSANLAFVHSLWDADAWRQQGYYYSLFEGAQARAEEMGFNLMPIWGAEPGMTPKRFTAILRNRSAMGLVIGPIRLDSQLPIDWERFPMAAMGTTLRQPQLHRAATYYTHAIPHAWCKLRELGYQSIGVMFSEAANRQVDFALEAGCAVLSASMGVPDLAVLRHNELTTRAFRKWVDNHHIDAIITDSGHHATKHLQKLHWRIPEDMGLVSLMSDREQSPGAIIMRNWTAIGATAVDLVVSQLWRNERGVPAIPKTVLIEGKWDSGSLRAPNTPP